MLNIIVCLYGLCFNPSHVVTLTYYKSVGSCEIVFNTSLMQKGPSALVVPGKSCEEVAKEINVATQEAIWMD